MRFLNTPPTSSGISLHEWFKQDCAINAIKCYCNCINSVWLGKCIKTIWTSDLCIVGKNWLSHVKHTHWNILFFIHGSSQFRPQTSCFNSVVHVIFTCLINWPKIRLKNVASNDSKFGPNWELDQGPLAPESLRSHYLCTAAPSQQSYMIHLFKLLPKDETVVQKPHTNWSYFQYIEIQEVIEKCTLSK